MKTMGQRGRSVWMCCKSADHRHDQTRRGKGARQEMDGKKGLKKRGGVVRGKE